MSSLKDRLEAISKGEIIETGSTHTVLPVFHDEEMKKCVARLMQLVESSQKIRRQWFGFGLHQTPSK